MRWGAGVHEGIARALGSPVKLARAVQGGDASEAAQLTLADGRRVFVKTREGCAPDTFRCEAEALGWLEAAGAVRVPEVLAVSDGTLGVPPFLALEWVEGAARDGAFEEVLGRGLAALHRAGAPCHGAARDGYLARFPQRNTPCATFAELWGTHRLEPRLLSLRLLPRELLTCSLDVAHPHRLRRRVRSQS